MVQQSTTRSSEPNPYVPGAVNESAPEPAEATPTRGRLLREGAWVVGGRVLGISTAISIDVFLARLVAPGDVGVFLLLAPIILFASMFAMLGLNAGLVRFVSEAIGEGDLEGARRTLRVGAVVGGFAVTLGGFLCFLFLRLFGYPIFKIDNIETIAPLVAICVGGVAVIQICAGLLRSFHNSRLSIFLTGQFGGPICNIIFVAGVFALSFSAIPTLGQVMGCCAVSICLLVPVSLFCTHRIGQNHLRTKLSPGRSCESVITYSTILVACVPMMLSQTLSIVTGFSDMWIAGALVSHDDLALYGAARRLTLLIGMPMQLVNLTVIASIAELRARGKLKELETILRSASTIAVLAALCVFLPLVLFPEWTISLVFGKFYVGGVTALRILAVGQILFVSAGAAELTLMMSGQHLKALWVNIVTSISAFLVGPILANQWGITGVAVAWSAIVSMQVGGFCMFARKSVGVWTPMDWRLLGQIPTLLKTIRSAKSGSSNSASS